MPSIIMLSPGEQARIRIGVKRRVFEFTKNNIEAASIFREIYHDIKVKFQVESYKHIQRGQMMILINFIESWNPSNISKSS